MFKSLPTVALVCFISCKYANCHSGEVFGSNALNPVPQDNHAPYNDYDNYYGPNYHDAIHIDLHKDTLDLIKMKMEELQLIKQHILEKKLNFKFALKQKLLELKEKAKPHNILIDYVNPEVHHHEVYPPTYQSYQPQPSYQPQHNYPPQPSYNPPNQPGNKPNNYDPYYGHY